MIAKANRPFSGSLDELRTTHTSPTTKPQPLSLEAIFQPQPSGRLITATQTQQGTRIEYRDNHGTHEHPDGLGEMVRHPMGESYEITRGGVSILAATTGENGDYFILRWADLFNGSNWLLMTNSQQFWRAMLFQTGFAFRLATGSTNVIDGPESTSIEIPAGSIFG